MILREVSRLDRLSSIAEATTNQNTRTEKILKPMLKEDFWLLTCRPTRWERNQTPFRDIITTSYTGMSLIRDISVVCCG
jgi:hypothetical protein